MSDIPAPPAPQEPPGAAAGGETLLRGRLNPLAMVIWMIHAGWQSIALVVFLATRGGGVRALAGVVLLAAAVLAWLHWVRFEYRVYADRLEVDAGVIRREHRVVPLQRVRGVTLEEPLLHRLFGVVRVRVDAAVAGDTKGELGLMAVSARQAEALRETVMRHRGEGGPADADGAGEPAAAPPTAVMSLAMTALEGATSLRYVAAPLAALVAVWNVLREVGLERIAWSGGRAAGRLLPTSLEGRVLLGATVVVLAVALAAVAAVIADGGFRLWLDRRRISTERGLLSRRRTAVERARVLGVEVSDSPLRRLLRVAVVHAPVGGMGVRADAESAGRVRVLPLGTRPDVTELAGRILPQAFGPLRRHPRAALRRRMVRALAVPVIALGVCLVGGWPLAAASAAALTALMAWVGVDRYRNLGHGAGETLRLRSGSLRRTHSALVVTSLVATEVSSTPFQRRAGLCSLELHLGLGAGQRTVTDLAPGQAARMVARIHPWAVDAAGADGDPAA